MIVVSRLTPSSIFFFNDTATTEIYTLSLHDALPICDCESEHDKRDEVEERRPSDRPVRAHGAGGDDGGDRVGGDRKSTRLNSSHLVISYAVFCLKKKQRRSCEGDHFHAVHMYVQHHA